MKTKQILAAVTAAAMLPFSGAFAVPSMAAEADFTVRLNPAEASPFNGGSFEGWGTSLCWWANRMGYSEKLTEQAADAFFSDDGLSLDIARYNIGGGDDPSHAHINRTDSSVPGVWETFELSADGNDVESITYDIENDRNQLNIALAALEANPDIYFEGFSNSPPYFMTNSGCSSGAVNAADDNLKPEMYDDFAKYIADATQLLKDNGIVFESYSPMNEPDTNYWGADSPKQEGCHYSPGESQSKAITETRKALDEAGLNDVIVAGMDETSIDTSVTNLDKLTDEAKAALGRIDTHTYSGSKRAALKAKAVEMGKTLWMSEVDNGGTAGTNPGDMGAGLNLANRILADMNGMQPAAWVLWDIIDIHKDSDAVAPDGSKSDANNSLNQSAGIWGVGMADHDTETLYLTQKYYVFGQFSKYIEPGDTIIASSDSTLAAYNKETGDIKIVAVNTSGSELKYDFDMQDFTSVGSSFKEIRTSGSYSGGEHWAEISGNSTLSGKTLSTTLIPNSVTTFVIDGVGATDYASITSDFDELCIGESHQLGIDTNLEYDGVEWSVSDDETASVSADGVITAKKAGDVTVYAKLGDYTASRTFTIPTYQRMRIDGYDMNGSHSWQYSDSSDYLKANDGDLSTYFDGLTNGYVSFDFKDQYTLDVIKFAPRNGYEDRIAGGTFQGSNDGITWTDVYKVPAEVPAMVYTEIDSDMLLTHTPFRWYRYTNSDHEANIAEIAFYGTKYEGAAPAGEPAVTDIAEMTDNFEGETNIFGAASGSLSADGSQVFDTMLSRYGNAFAPVKATATAELPEALTIDENQLFRLRYTMFAGWESSGEENTLTLKDESGNELVAIRLTGGGYTLEEVRIGGENALSGKPVSQSRCSTASTRNGANGWFLSSQAFANNVEFNKTVEITIDGAGNVNVSLTGGLEDASCSGTLGAPVNIKSLTAEGSYHSDIHRITGYDNFDADIITYGDVQEPEPTAPVSPTAPPDSGSVLISLDFNDQDLSSGSQYGKAEAIGSVEYGEGEDGSSCLYFDGSGSGYVKLTDANGNSLLSGRDEITVSFKVKPTTSSSASWWMYAAPNDDVQVYESEHYIGLLGDTKLTAERYNSNKQSRPASASAEYAIGEWNDVLVSFGADSTSVYINGTKVSEQASEHSLADVLGDTPVAYIGFANWVNGEYASGYIDDFAIYDLAVPSIDLGDISDVRSDIDLPSSIDGCDVSWSSSDEDIIAADGTVTRPESGQHTITLTADVTVKGDFGSITVKQPFEASVTGVVYDAETFRAYIENGEVKFAFDSLDSIPYDVYVALYDEEGVLKGIKMNAESGVFALDDYGKYTAVCYVWDDSNVSKHEPVRKILNYSEDDMEEKNAYLFVHFVGNESTADSEQIYFSVSEDGQTWTTLNEGNPVLTSSVGELGVRDPYILRGEDGKFFIIATDLSIYERRGDSDRWATCQRSGSRSIVVWESDDLVNWSEASLVEVAVDNAGCTWAPEAVYDPEKDMYMVFWASKISDDDYSKQRVYRCYTSDFKTFTAPEVYIDYPESSIDTTITEDEGIYYRFTKNEAKSSIIMESSTSLSGPWKAVESYNLSDMTGYEGPAVYKMNDGSGWCLLLDYFSRSQGYKPFVTNDIKAGVFTQASDFSFDDKYRHGTVLPITAEEYAALTEKY